MMRFIIKKWVLAFMAGLIFCLYAAGANGGDLRIEFTKVPPKGSFENLEGQVRHADIDSYGVAVYIYVNGWWNKPYWDAPVTKLSRNGDFNVDITTGGTDSSADRIVAFLVPIEYDPPLMSGERNLPDELFNVASGCAFITR